MTKVVKVNSAGLQNVPSLYLSLPDCQSSHVQWLKGNWGFSCVIPLWRTLLVMNVGKMCTLTKITEPRKAHGSSFNEYIFFPVFLYMVHHSTDPCCRMWPEWRSKLDKLDNPKGLQSLSGQTEGEKNFLLLKDYFLTSHIDSPSEWEERNQQWLDKKPRFGHCIIVSTWHTL